MKNFGLFLVAAATVLGWTSGTPCSQVLSGVSLVGGRTCSVAKSELEHAIGQCEITGDDTVLAVGRLRVLIQDLSTNDCLGATGNNAACAGVFSSADLVLNSGATTIDTCDGTSYQDFEDDMVDAKSNGCEISGNMMTLVDSGFNRVCFGPWCVSNDGVYKTTAGNGCTQFTQQLLDGTGRKFTYNVSPGTMFDVTLCRQDRIVTENCRN